MKVYNTVVVVRKKNALVFITEFMIDRSGRTIWLTTAVGDDYVEMVPKRVKRFNRLTAAGRIHRDRTGRPASLVYLVAKPR